MQSNQTDGGTSNATGDRRPDDAVEWFKYIEWQDLPAWEAVGWRLINPVNEYGALAKWDGAGEPRLV
jgi:hypothetical protein